MHVVGVHILCQVIGIMQVLTLSVTLQGWNIVCSTLWYSVIEWFVNYLHAVGVIVAALVYLTFVIYLILATAHLVCRRRFLQRTICLFLGYVFSVIVVV